MKDLRVRLASQFCRQLVFLNKIAESVIFGSAFEKNGGLKTWKNCRKEMCFKKITILMAGP